MYASCQPLPILSSAIISYRCCSVRLSFCFHISIFHWNELQKYNEIYDIYDNVDIYF